MPGYEGWQQPQVTDTGAEQPAEGGGTPAPQTDAAPEPESEPSPAEKEEDLDKELDDIFGI